jgi:hypothetical protein
MLEETRISWPLWAFITILVVVGLFVLEAGLYILRHRAHMCRQPRRDRESPIEAITPAKTVKHDDGVSLNHVQDTSCHPPDVPVIRTHRPSWTNSIWTGWKRYAPNVAPVHSNTDLEPEIATASANGRDNTRQSDKRSESSYMESRNAMDRHEYRPSGSAQLCDSGRGSYFWRPRHVSITSDNTGRITPQHERFARALPSQGSISPSEEYDLNGESFLLLSPTHTPRHYFPTERMPSHPMPVVKPVSRWSETSDGQFSSY